jgi:hypothetical protein
MNIKSISFLFLLLCCCSKLDKDYSLLRGGVWRLEKIVVDSATLNSIPFELKNYEGFEMLEFKKKTCEKYVYWMSYGIHQNFISSLFLNGYGKTIRKAVRDQCKCNEEGKPNGRFYCVEYINEGNGFYRINGKRLELTPISSRGQHIQYDNFKDELEAKRKAYIRGLVYRIMQNNHNFLITKDSLVISDSLNRTVTFRKEKA